MIDWEKIDNVFLDMDGTLLDLNFGGFSGNHAVWWNDTHPAFIWVIIVPS